MTAANASVVSLSHVSKTFGTAGAGTVALSDISVEIGRGDFVSLIGPSGCGKSTLLRLIGDLTEPTGGTIQVNGKPAVQARLDRDYGMVFQAPVLCCHFSTKTISISFLFSASATRSTSSA